ncbi:MAG: iron-only hydrogenase system regulator [Caldisericaceae bacterium]|nr:iron-only hydrogenase system regulator [Caldisericaceae bacterium]RLD17569.1 MAG: CopG family transcriptional regulator [Caldisericota bacterium]
MKKRLGVVGIIIESRDEYAPKVNSILTQYGNIIKGRLGLPYSERNISVISIIVDGTVEEIGALTGKLGILEGVMVRSVLSKEK